LLHRPPSPDTPTGAAKPGFRADTLTPIPAATKTAGGAKTEETASEPKPPSTPSVARYIYKSPAKPLAGDRRTAEGLFNSGRLAEQAEKWVEALQDYEGAAAADPAWFEAQYNAGLTALRLHEYSRALPHYELALALQPDSASVRSYFALALRFSGYSVDAAEELHKILAANPNDVRAHLDLANLCAQSLHDVAQARQHYLRVLELQPDHPLANNIRFWLSANAK
jgi:tetratricopeptide (TPR) repeat protein